jgi:hypothetical protein
MTEVGAHTVVSVVQNARMLSEAPIRSDSISPDNLFKDCFGMYSSVGVGHNGGIEGQEGVVDTTEMR